MSVQFNPGSTLELLVNANPIPSGRYRFVGETDGGLLFSVGSEIQFWLKSSYWTPFLRHVPGISPHRTGKTEFIRRYVNLVVEHRLAPRIGDPEALTMCAVSFKVHKKMLNDAKRLTIQKMHERSPLGVQRIPELVQSAPVG